MIICGISFFLLSLVLIINNPRSRAARWGSAASFVSGMGALSVIWEENIIPYLERTMDISDSTHTILYVIQMIMNATAFYGIPYTLLNYALSYSEYVKGKLERWVPLILFIPILINIAAYPTYKYFFTTEQEIVKFHISLCTWSIPYVIACNVIMIVSAVREKNIKLRKQRRGMAIVVVPFATVGVFDTFVTPILGIKEAWRVNWLLGAQFIVFMFFAAKYGLMGIRFKMETARIDSTIDAVNSSTILLNHTLKNEIMKMDICMKNIQREMGKQEKDRLAIGENIKIVENSTKHLLDMVDSMDEKVGDVTITEEYHPLGEIIQEALQMVGQFLESKGVKVRQNTSEDLSLLCDRVHMKEVLINVLKNAIEALQADGTIYLETGFFKDEFTITVKDNGKGISKENLSHVMKPFFTTKRGTKNFGLGLSYCYKIMKKHYGYIEIQSQEDIGTTVLLSFPAKRALTIGKRYGLSS
ncbi:MAG: HAMP domain-containing histidine kinase [Clostridia bacterium]|nr:HAMP domain-containing histidine kinase [Clostridia bacterium]